MNLQSKIYTPGHHGMASSAILRNLEAKGYHNIITRTHSELDLINQQVLNNFFELGLYLCISTKLIFVRYSKLKEIRVDYLIQMNILFLKHNGQ